MEKSRKKALAPLLILAACALYMVSGGIRANFGIIVQALADRTGVTYADVSFAVAVGQLMYGATQPLFGMLGSVLCGFLCQRLPLKNVLGTLYGVRAVIVALFMLAMPKNVFTVFLFITVLGMTGDATVTPTSEIVSRRFGPESLGFLFGITFVCHQIGGFLSSWLGGVFITKSGNYQIIWMMDIALCAIAAVASYRVQRNVVRA